MLAGNPTTPKTLFRFENYGNKMVHDLFDGTKGFAIDGGIKDSAHIRKLATDVNCPMPALVCPIFLSVS